MWLCFNIFLDLLIAYNALFILFLTNLICAFQSSLLSKYNGKSMIAWRYFLHGQTLSGEISNLTNSAVSWPNTNFSGLSVIPLRPHKSSHWHAWKKQSSKLYDQSNVLSMHLVFCGKSETIKYSGISITRCDVTLGSSAVAVSAPWRYEGG